MSGYLAYTHERNFGCRLREIVYRGHRCVTLENERLRLLVVADKGADLLERLYKPLDLELLWRSYHGLRRAGSGSPVTTRLEATVFTDRTEVTAVLPGGEIRPGV